MNDGCPRCGAELLGERLPVCPRCLFASDPPAALIGGSIALEEEIGRGGMGSVFRAHHLGLDRTVAVKFLPPDLAADPEFRARFEREARILARLEHPNVVAVYDFGEDEGQWYIVMEHVEGAPLATLMPQPPRRAVEIAREVCRALAHAHAKGVVHRDIKPENILIGADGRVKVTDFGIARLIAPTPALPALTAPERAAGTPYYVAPEALQGAPPDPRMDLYSLGVVLHQMITGRLPVTGIGPLPADLDRIVRRLLATEPAERYGSAEDLEHDLAAARLPDAVEKSRQERRDDDRAWTYAVALLLTVATATALWAFLVSATPRVLRSDEVMPLVMVPPERLPDGRVLSRARFETWPILGALATFAGRARRRRFAPLLLAARRPDRP